MDPRVLVGRTNILKGVVALVEVKSSLGNPALAISSRLHSLGAEVVRTLGPRVTHVIFRNGSEAILQAARRARKHIVTPAWVKACHTYNFRAVESSFGVTEKQDITLLDATVEKTTSLSNKVKQNRDDITAPAAISLSSQPIPWRGRKDQTLKPLPVPQEVLKFLQRVEKRNPSRSSQGFLSSFSDNEEKSLQKSLSTKDDQITNLTNLSKKAFKTPENVPVEPSETSSVLSNQSECGSPNRSVLLDPVVLISSIPTTSATCPEAPKSLKRLTSSHRHLLPSDAHYSTDNLISPVVMGAKPHTATPSWLKHVRSDHLLSSKKERLSPRTPLTPNLLLDVVRSAHTPKSTNKQNKTNATQSSSTKSPVQRVRKKVVRIIPRSLVRQRLTSSVKRDTIDLPSSSSTQPHCPLSAKHSTSRKRPSPSDETNTPEKSDAVPMKRRRSSCSKSQPSAGSKRNLRCLNIMNGKVDLDESDQSSTNAFHRRGRRSTLRTLCLSSPESPEVQQTKEEQVSSSRRRTSNFRRATEKPQPVVSSKTQENRCITPHNRRVTFAAPEFPHVPLNSQASQPSSVTPIRPLTARNSLEDFQLPDTRTHRKRGRVKKTDLPLIPTDADGMENTPTKIVISFTGLRRDEETTMCTLLATSSLSNYRLATRRDLPAPLSTRETRAAEDAKPTHLVTVNPFRRTLKFLRGLIQGVNIVTVDWLRDSAQCGLWLCPAAFKPEGLPRDSKLRHLPSLFTTCGTIYVGPTAQPPADDLLYLLRLCGAKITSSKSKASLLIGCVRPGATCIKPAWVLDSITKAQLQSTAQYSMSS